MHYAVSDLHGCCDLYLKLLDRLALRDSDTLFFLGDAADRGPDGIALMQDLIRRENVLCLLGNHEDMFRRVARGKERKLSSIRNTAFDRTFVNWTQRNGGEITWRSYLALPEQAQQEIVNWMENLPTYYELTLNGRNFLLSHAGVGAYAPEKDPASCGLFDFIWERMDYDKIYYRDKLLVTGHTPTVLIDPFKRGRIIQKNNHVAIDCGAVYTGVLGCICLETLEEFYVYQ